MELDHDRKEELILAKQLRACRVQILPKVRLRLRITVWRYKSLYLSEQ